jgi:rubrerythrin
MGGFFAKDILDAAIQIEKNGKAFYEQIARLVKEREAKSTFEFLAAEEERHMEEIKALSEGLSGPPETLEREEFELYLRGLVSEHIFTEDGAGLRKASEIKDAIDAVDIAIGFEKDSIIFFEELYPLLRKKDHHVLEKLIKLEREHLANLISLKKKLLEASADQLP